MVQEFVLGYVTFTLCHCYTAYQKDYTDLAALIYLNDLLLLKLDVLSEWHLHRFTTCPSPNADTGLLKNVKMLCSMFLYLSLIVYVLCLNASYQILLNLLIHNNSNITFTRTL